MSPASLTRGQAQIEVEELDALARAAAIDVERQDALVHVGPVAKDQVPAAGGSTDADRQLAE